MAENLFKTRWSKEIRKDLSDMVAEESDGAAKYHAMGDKFHVMAEQEEGHKEALEEMETKKAGNIICSNCGAVNPPTEMACLDCGYTLKGRDSKKSVDTSYAGGIPNSKLARQDLENTQKGANKWIQITRDFGMGYIEEQKTWFIEDKDGNNMGENDSKSGAENACRALQREKDKTNKSVNTGYIDKILDAGVYEISILANSQGGPYVYTVSAREKGNLGSIESQTFAKLDQAMRQAQMWKSKYSKMNKSVTSTTNQLNEVKDKAEDADTKAEKHDVVDSIKAIQLKRQKATIKERENTAKSFKEGWNRLNKGSGSENCDVCGKTMSNKEYEENNGVCEDCSSDN
jgi:transcription initiation factor TFIIIB Brf1 subunit/transcription initiation factor TFIIB